MEAKFTKNIVISGVLLTLSVIFITGTLKVAQKGSRLIEAKKELEALERQKMALEQEAEYRKSSEFIEEEARNKLNMIKPGEEVYLKPKILGDDLLGAQDGRNNGTASPKNLPVLTQLFDKIKQFLLLFQG